ncbi:MAG TPA: class I SAM-dependent methyltransferase [Rhodothermales bacterium]|nr:class I SAM-dependent methyltransferase [Rhodothermales bacterium]
MPEITPERATHFTRRALALVDKGSSSIAEIDHVSRSRHPLSYGSVLEIGCGTGGFLLAGSEKFDRVIGTDLSMAWLVIARKRLEERGVEGFLACAGAEHLPFRSGAFDLVVAEDVIEHVQDQERTMQECARVLGKAGILFLATPNRFSFTPEPHVGLWGVGFLPRRWMSRYVRWARGVTYDDIRIVSYFELTGLLSRARFKNYHVVLPALNADEVSGFSPLKRRLVPLYDFLRGQPVFRPFLLVSGPFFHVFGYGGERPAS